LFLGAAAASALRALLPPLRYGFARRSYLIPFGYFGTASLRSAALRIASPPDSFLRLPRKPTFSKNNSELPIYRHLATKIDKNFDKIKFTTKHK
jgi:hypothetical protein